MIKIPLTQNKFAIIDKEDLKKVSQWKWYLDGRYVTHDYWREGKKSKIYLHRFILNNPMNKDVDHINGNKLDNRKTNLRICTRAENLRNSKKHLDNKSGFKGVYWHKRNKRWIANIYLNGKQTYLGSFENKFNAYKIYRETSIKNFGEFANYV